MIKIIHLDWLKNLRLLSMPDTILSNLYVLSHLIVWDYSQHVCVLSLFSCVGLRDSCQVALSMEFSRQEYWSGLPCPPPGDLPDPEVELESLSCIDWGVLHHWCHPGSPNYYI